MVDPMGTLRLKIQGLASQPAAGTAIAFSVINDYGGVTPFKGSVAP